MLTKKANTLTKKATMMSIQKKVMTTMLATKVTTTLKPKKRFPTQLDALPTQ